MKRRSFFSSIARAAAIVALAPQLAFRVKPAMPVAVPQPQNHEMVGYWYETSRHSECYSDEYIAAMTAILSQSKKVSELFPRV